MSACVAVALTFASYRPGLPGSFIFDDGPAISKNTAIQIHTLDLDSLRQAAFSSDSGTLKRPLSMLSFALNYYATGLDARSFKLTNIAIHSLTGLCLGLLTVLLLSAPALPAMNLNRRHLIASAVMLAWLVHPFLLTGVLYTVQRMTSLAGLFTVLGAISYTYGRLLQTKHCRGGWFLLTGMFLFTVLAILCKENGLLLPLFLFVIEVCFFRFQTTTTEQGRWLTFVFGMAALILFTGALTVMLTHHSWIFGGYQVRDFSLPQRLYTETRVLVWYLRMILLPDIGQMGLHHDDIELSTGLLSPFTTLPAVILLFSMFVTALLVWKKQPILSFGLMWFLTGHLLESTILPLELVYEHRNYIPAFGIILILLYYLFQYRPKGLHIALRVFVATLYISFMAFSLQARAGQWSNEFQFATRSVRNHPRSARAHYYLATRYLNVSSSSQAARTDLLAEAERHSNEALRLNPQMFASMVLLTYLHGLQDKPVPPQLIERMQSTLENHSISSSTSNALWLLTECSIQQICRLTVNTYLEICLAALTNNTISAHQKAIILKYLSIYFGRGLRDFDTARFYINLSIKEDPEYIDPRYNRIEWAVHTRNYSEALTEIDKIRALDTTGKESLKIHQLRNTILGLYHKD